MCIKCSQRWNNFIIEEKMKKEIKETKQDTKTTVVEKVSNSKPDIDKIIADRRKVVESGSVTNK